MIFDERRTDGVLALRDPYSAGSEPVTGQRSCSCAGAPVSGTEHIWLHTLEQVLGSLLDGGLRIERFREYPLLAWPQFRGMELAEPGWYRLPGSRAPIPLTMAVTARK
jgi:hypothetical protein